jgi:hypothetical protein
MTWHLVFRDVERTGMDDSLTVCTLYILLDDAKPHGSIRTLYLQGRRSQIYACASRVTGPIVEITERTLIYAYYITAKTGLINSLFYTTFPSPIHSCAIITWVYFVSGRKHDM